VWHISDFRPGDALFFHAFTVHKAMPNLSGNRMRLSTDNRYQRPNEAVEPGALKPHFDLN
jgi:ectoine hydroxylase-related dioxygenase (phytanoyl-CoA dioxygenase family)